MATVGDITGWMQGVAPLGLSETWDNTGLLMGDPSEPVVRVQTCLTLTPESVDEAIREQANLVIAHHPLPFKPLNRITTETVAGRLLWKLARAGVAIYAPHTAWDSAAGGINDQLAEKLGLSDVEPLIPSELAEHSGLGAGRIGNLPESLTVGALSERMTKLIPECRPRGVDCGQEVRRVAIACGSGASLLAAAANKECDVFVTGEATFHGCLESQAMHISMLMIGHFASERFSLVHLASLVSKEFPEVQAWASKFEKDPVRIFTLGASL